MTFIFANVSHCFKQAVLSLKIKISMLVYWITDKQVQRLLGVCMFSFLNPTKSWKNVKF